MNVFPSPYTRKKCELTHLFLKMLSHCDNVPNHWKQYVRPHHKKSWNYKNYDRTDENIVDCLWTYLDDREELPQLGFERCPLPCEEVIYQTEFRQIANTSDTISAFYFSFRTKTITEVHEIAVYTTDDFFSDVGSWLGLLVGMSVLSLVEIVAFTYNVIKEKCSQGT